ncbi:ATP-binding cassette domain-containing protein [Rhizobiaceae bacterium]|nr:ATP-binding cassette domain-containing protein [Rhizobiaceae bacterium]
MTLLHDHDTALLRLEGAGLHRDGRWLVRNVDLSVAKGEIVTLVGPNGSGKTSTIRLALGIEAADEGAVKRDATLRVGYVPQRLSVDANLPLDVARFMRLTGPIDASIIDASLERTGVSHLRNAAARGLSGGELQRVLLARALARKPNLLVLDEPVQGIDFTGQIALYRLIADLRDELDAGILLVSHDLHIVMAATDRVVCLNGHVCCEGTPRAVADDPTYRAMFGPAASEALAVYRHDHDHTHLPDGSVLHADGTVSERCEPSSP